MYMPILFHFQQTLGAMTELDPSLLLSMWDDSNLGAMTQLTLNNLFGANLCQILMTTQVSQLNPFHEVLNG